MTPDYAPDWTRQYLERFVRRPDKGFRVTHHDFADLEWFERCAIAEVKQELCERLRRLPYPEFLETRYWLMVRAHKVHLAGTLRCEHCNDRAEEYVLHHRRYLHHGEEHRWLDDLVFLCRKCHRIAHSYGNEQKNWSQGNQMEIIINRLCRMV